MKKTPVQVVIVRKREDHKTDAFVEAIRLVLQGPSDTKNKQRYLSDSVNLDIPLLEPRLKPNDANASKTSRSPVDSLLSAAQHTVLLEIRSSDHQGWSPATQSLIDKIPPDSRLTQATPEDVANGPIQASHTGIGDVEPGLVPVVTAILVLETIRQKLSVGAQEANPLKFFISHAKIDGAPFALSILDLLNRMRTLVGQHASGALKYFYDAESLEPGDDWATKLEDAASNSVMIVVRTDEYPNRYWCSQEYSWAERNAMPMLVVDLRSQLFEHGGALPFSHAASTKVTDGNLLRIVLHTVANHIALLKFEYELRCDGIVPPEAAVLPRYPSLESLQGVIERDADRKLKSIHYIGKPMSGDKKQFWGVRLGGTRSPIEFRSNEEH